jgi:hypothetical protein
MSEFPHAEKNQCPVFDDEDPDEMAMASYCFACAEAADRNGGMCDRCKCCPITPASEADCCSGLYQKWVSLHSAKDKKSAAERSRLARQIAMLPWRGPDE